MKSKYSPEDQRTYNILIKFTYLMKSKLIFLLINFVMFNSLPALEQVRGLFRTASNITMEFFSKIVSNVILKLLNCSHKLIHLWCLSGSRTCFCRLIQHSQYNSNWEISMAACKQDNIFHFRVWNRRLPLQLFFLLNAHQSIIAIYPQPTQFIIFYEKRTKNLIKT